MESSETLGKKESEPNLLFKVTLMRHEKPFYKDEGHDLTPEGVERSIETGKRLKTERIISDEDEMHLIHSPTARAKGTLDFVAEAAGLGDKPKTSINQLRKSDMPNRDELMARWNELEMDFEKIAMDHHKHEMYEKRPDIIEPHSHKKERLYRTFEYLIKWFESHPSEGKTPHVLAVSHYELITHIIHDVFDIENIGRYDAPAFGEIVYIEAHKSEVPDEVKLKVTYDGNVKEVVFNRKTRLIENIS